MSRITCTRRLEFDYGHRVYKHESKCASVHGHRGVVEITAEAENLDPIGRIVDFSVLKEKIGGWIDENWDHKFLVYIDDKELINALLLVSDNALPFICRFNPTAENMAKFLLEEICPQVLEGTGVKIISVIMHETPNGRAEARL